MDTDLRPILIYDGKCGFCGIWMAYWQQLTGAQVAYVSSQEIGTDFPAISPEDFKRSVWLVLPDGARFSGAEAVFRLMAFADGKQWPLRLYERLPGFATLSEAAYRLVARHRNAFYWLTRLFWGKQVVPDSYQLSRSLFLRGLGLVYLIAFLSLAPQVLGLIGENGIAPVGTYLYAVRSQIGNQAYWAVPTLTWFNSNDAFLLMLCWGGASLAAALLVGFVPMIALVGLFVLYTSFVNVGQDFLLFQWDALLLETGFAALLLAPRGIRSRYAVEPSVAARWVLRFLLFRLMLESGLVKLLSGDPNWRGLTALNYHYETQPLPTPLAWYAQHLPAWFQRISVLGVFATELVVPFFFLMPRRFRLIGAWLTIVFQLAIAATGNYTFFNLLTIILCVALLDDRHLHFRKRTDDFAVESGRSGRFATIIATLLIGVGLLELATPLANAKAIPSPIAWIEDQAESWHVVNPYGLFAVMTTSRQEIVVEGSNDETQWKEFKFKFKAGDDLTQAPHWVAPYQPRLDWQMWFAALSDYRGTPWFSQFMLRLLEGSPDVLTLLKVNPFPDGPPKFVRAVIYDYHFSDSETRRTTGAWWTRKYLGLYFPSVSLKP